MNLVVRSVEFEGKRSRKKYKARMTMRADDSIPIADSLEKLEAVLSISDRLLRFFFFKVPDFPSLSSITH